MQTPISCDIAIVGGGASGALVAMQLLRRARSPLRIVLVEPAAVAHGAAYATTRPEHLLNVPAARMSAFPDRPDDFAAWLSSNTAADASSSFASGERYAQRRQYAAYLQARLEAARTESPASLEVVADRVIACDDAADGRQCLTLGCGARVQARHIVLAIGNAARPLPVPDADALNAGAVLEAWDHSAIGRIARDADVTVVGSGLSMVDVALTLAAGGHGGTLHVVSRHALLPCAHEPVYRSADYPAARLQPLSLRARMRVLRADAAALAQAGTPWQEPMNALRPHVRALWRTLDAHDQARFLRHVARYWDVHRHRIAPEVHATLERLRMQGRLRLHRGRIATIRPQEGALQVEALARDGRRSQWRCAHVVNATGVELRAARMRQPLLDDLLAAGRVRAGPHGIGLDVDADGASLDRNGHPNRHLSVIGSLRIGNELESIAIPDLREDAAQIAMRILAEIDSG